MKWATIKQSQLRETLQNQQSTSHSYATVWLQIFVKQYFHDFGNTLQLCIIKILDLKILVLRVFSMSFFKCFKPVSKNSLPLPMETFLYCSIQFYSCSKPASVKIATCQCD